MQSAAAYYVLVAQDLARQSDARYRQVHAVQKPSRLSTLVASLFRPVRRAGASTASAA
jgi:hypothetical protein